MNMSGVLIGEAVCWVVWCITWGWLMGYVLDKMEE